MNLDTQFRLGFYAFGLVVMTCAALALLDERGQIGLFSLALLGLGLVLGSLKILAITRREILEIVASPSQLTVRVNGTVKEVYSLNHAIAFRFAKDGRAHWIQLDLKHGASMRIGYRAVSFPDLRTAQRRIYRQLVRTIPCQGGLVNSASQLQIQTPITQYIEAQDYTPSSVTLRPGVRYRYTRWFMQDIETSLELRSSRSYYPLAIIPLAPALSLIVSQLSITHEWKLAIMSLPFLAVVVAHYFRPQHAFLRSKDDRFELVPEGIRITRRHRSWIVSDPTPALGNGGELTLADVPVVRFGRGTKAYYFDPRFIEPDV